MAQPGSPLSAAAPDWAPIPSSEAGFAPDLKARLDKLIADKRAWNLHGVVIVRGGQLVLERYFEGEDNARGRPLGKVAFKPDTLHDMCSVSKGIVGLLYGIALERGKVQRLFVFAGLKLVVAITAGNYGADDQWVPPTRVVHEVVLPSIR